MMTAATRYTEAQIKSIEKRIISLYKKASKETQRKMYAYLKQFKGQDRKKQAQLDAGEITKAQYQQWRFSQMMSGAEWFEVQESITNSLVKTDEAAASIANEILPDVYAEAHAYSTYEIETGAEKDTNYSLYTAAIVAGMMATGEINVRKSSVNKQKDKTWTRRHVNTSVLSGLWKGKSLRDVATSMKGVTDMNQRASIRTARTMARCAESKGDYDAGIRAKELGIEYENVWLATLDSRTRDSHRDLDGERRKPGEPFSNGLLHPRDTSGRVEEWQNCRCTMLKEFPGHEIDVRNLEDRREQTC